MTDADAFLQTILDDPDDDLPRLIFADWLEEHGDTGRAEFIRAQLERATLPVGSDRSQQLLGRERTLLRQHGAHWLQPIRQAMGDPQQPGAVRQLVESALGRREITSWGWHLENGVEYRRGFVHSLSMTTAALNAYGEAVVRLAPIEEIILDVHYPFTELTFVAPAPLARVRSLTVFGPNLMRPIGELLGVPLPKLRSLCLAGAITPEELDPAFVLPLTAIASALHHLELFGGQYIGSRRNVWQSSRFFDYDLIAALLRLPLDELQSLTLDCGGFGDRAAALLATNRPWPKLTALRLPRCHLQNVTAFANSPNFPALAMLDLEDNYINDASALALANSPHLPNLALVYLKGNPLSGVVRDVLRERFGAGLRL